VHCAAAIHKNAAYTVTKFQWKEQTRTLPNLIFVTIIAIAMIMSILLIT